MDWPDLRAPRSPGRTRDQLADVRHRIRAGQRVEIACAGGRGRTGTALAALAILDGLSADRAVAWVQSAYDPRAVETRAQHRFLVRLARARPAP
ncbi:MAG: protein-tyrosine phosphatase family protein [Actinomycetota bacterium]